MAVMILFYDSAGHRAAPGISLLSDSSLHIILPATYTAIKVTLSHLTQMAFMPPPNDQQLGPSPPHHSACACFIMTFRVCMNMQGQLLC